MQNRQKAKYLLPTRPVNEVTLVRPVKKHKF